MTGPVDPDAAAAALRVLYEPANWDWFTSGAAPAGGDDQGQARTQVLQNLGHHFSPETRDTFYRALQHSALLKQDWLARITQLSEPQDDLYSTSYDTTSFAPKALILFASTPAAVTPDAQLRIRDIADTYTQIATNTMAVGAGTMDLAEAARRNRDARERLLAELRSAPYSVLPEQNREPMRQLLDGDVLRARQSSVDAPEPSSLARRNRAINDHGRHPDPLSLRDELRSRFGRGKATGPTPVAGLKAAGWMLSGPLGPFIALGETLAAVGTIAKRRLRNFFDDGLEANRRVDEAKSQETTRNLQLNSIEDVLSARSQSGDIQLSPEDQSKLSAIASALPSPALDEVHGSFVRLNRAAETALAQGNTPDLHREASELLRDQVRDLLTLDVADLNKIDQVKSASHTRPLRADEVTGSFDHVGGGNPGQRRDGHIQLTGDGPAERPTNVGSSRPVLSADSNQPHEDLSNKAGKEEALSEEIRRRVHKIDGSKPSPKAARRHTPPPEPGQGIGLT